MQITIPESIKKHVLTVLMGLILTPIIIGGVTRGQEIWNLPEDKKELVDRYTRHHIEDSTRIADLETQVSILNYKQRQDSITMTAVNDIFEPWMPNVVINNISYKQDAEGNIYYILPNGWLTRVYWDNESGKYYYHSPWRKKYLR